MGTMLGAAGDPGCAASPPQAPGVVVPPERPLRILHLEDNPADSELLLEHLADEDFDVVLQRVETRREFEAALAADDADLIVSDFQLPSFDGISAFLLAREIRPEVPFIMLTGKLGEEYAIDTLKLGVTDYVLKQGLTRLAPAVHRALVQREERAQRREAQEQLQRYRENLEELVRQRTAELEVRNAQLDLANQDLETLAAAATHDLRNPLVVIGGFARRLARRRDVGEDADAGALLQGIIESAARMERLLGDLHQFFHASGAELKRVPIDVERLVREAFDDLRPIVGERRVDLEVAPLPMGFGDRAMIRQVAINLLGNAVKYTRSREQALIEVSGWEEPAATGYCVRDNGIGFDAGACERVFRLFERLPEADAFPGTGVGLAMVKRVLEKHGGKAWASSAPGAGARFFFTLPRSAAAGSA